MEVLNGPGHNLALHGFVGVMNICTRDVEPNCGRDHLGPPQQKEMQQILSNSWLIMGFIMGRVKFFSNFLLSLRPQQLCWGHI